LDALVKFAMVEEDHEQVPRMRTPGLIDAVNHFAQGRTDEGIEKEEHVAIVRRRERGGVQTMNLHVSRSPMFHGPEIAAGDAGQGLGNLYPDHFLKWIGRGSR
jgi:hypothetical protein